jgi:DNA-binding NarL/FixJ family response regulator
MSNSRINLVIGGGRKLFREGLCLLLEKHGAAVVVGEAEETRQVQQLLKAMTVHVVILNLTTPLPGDLELIRAIRRAHRGPRVIALTLHPSIEYVQELMDAGATGCLSQECAGAELVAAVEKAMAGGVYLSSALVDRVVNRYVRPTSKQRPDRPLAPRQRQILLMIASGQRVKEIAAALSISSKTVETHRRRIMEKLNRHSVAELTKYAIAEGLTPLDTIS